MCSDGYDAISKLKGFQLGATVEGVIADFGHAVQNHDFFDRAFQGSPGLIIAGIVIDRADSFKRQHAVAVECPSHSLATSAGIDDTLNVDGIIHI